MIKRPDPKPRKIKAQNPWRDPRPPTDPFYLSPHCQNAMCKWCKERRRRAAGAETAALAARLAADMFDPWDRKIGGVQEQLGPSAPDSWLIPYVKPAAPGPHIMDVLGYWGPPKR